MKLLQIIPKEGNETSLKALLKKKERELRGTATTFVRTGEGRWVHKSKNYPGWINWDEVRGGLLVAEVQTKKDGMEWRLLQAFIGYLDRHLHDHFESISITYR